MHTPTIPPRLDKVHFDDTFVVWVAVALWRTGGDVVTAMQRRQRLAPDRWLQGPGLPLFAGESRMGPPYHRLHQQHQRPAAVAAVAAAAAAAAAVVGIAAAAVVAGMVLAGGVSRVHNAAAADVADVADAAAAACGAAAAAWMLLPGAVNTAG